MNDMSITREKRNELMLKAPVEKAILRLSGPTIVSMLTTSIYNMADTFFVGKINTSTSGAVGVVFSAMMIIQAFAFMIGMGAGNNISRFLGAGKSGEAEKFAATAWFTGFGLGTVFAVVGTVFLKDIVMLLGSTDTIAPYAMNYAGFIFKAAPFMMCSFIMNNILRFQGLAFYSMFGITAGGVLNIILDPIFMFGLHMGVGGAGLATALSQTASFLILLVMCNARKGAISIRIKNFRPSLTIYGRIFYTGMPSLARQGIASVSMIFLNTIAKGYGDAAIAALSIVSRYTMFVNSVIIGFGQGFQPVCAFNFGAKRPGRVIRAFWFCVKTATAVLAALCVTSLIFSGHIIELFRKGDPSVIEIGTFALRAQLVVMPCWGFYTMSNMLTQSIGYGFRASLIACSRQGLILIPVLAVLPKVLGLNGLLLAQPLSDVLACIFAFFIVNKILREIKSI